MSSTAIYYPYFAARPTWYRSALLYWECVRRIVPVELGREVVADDPPEVEVLRGKNLILETNSYPYIKGACERFRAAVMGPQLSATDLPLGRRLRAIVAERDARSEAVSLLKVTPELCDELQECGMATERNGWLWMPAGVANLYMSCLASVMAECIKCPPVTDQTNMEWRGQYLSFSSPDGPEAGVSRSHVLCRVGVKLPSEVALARLSTEDFLKLREETAEVRQTLRRKVECLVEEAVSLTDQNALDDFFAAHANEIEKGRVTYSSLLNRLGLDSVEGVLNISCPALLGGAADHFSGDVGNRITVGGVVLSLGLLGFRMWRAAKDEMASDPYHYLAVLKKRVG